MSSRRVGKPRTGRGSRAGLRTAAAAVAVLLLLAGCAPPADREFGGAPGTLTVAAAADSGETLNPYASNGGPTQEMRNAQLYEGLTEVDPRGHVVWRLATNMTPNKSLTQWTIALRPHVRFTDGSPFGADDVIASIKYIMDPAHAAQGANVLTDIGIRDLVKVDDLTVRVRLARPYGPFKDLWANDHLYMTKAGSVPGNPVGTGPFRSAEFVPGQGSTLERFGGYWGRKPRSAKMAILEFQTEQGQINALQSGQVDVASQATPAVAKLLERKPGIELLVDRSRYHMLISFRTDVAPFDDPLVRRAMRLIIDRDQVVSNALGGFGRVANDQEGGSRDYCPAPSVPQRRQDIGKARRLLAKAGHSDLSFSIATDRAQPAMTQLIQVFAENAARAGVQVRVNQVSTPRLLAKWGQWPAYIDYNTGPYLKTVASNLVPGGVGNATHWNNRRFVDLAHQLFRTADPIQQCTLENKMHAIEYRAGGSIVAAWRNVVIPHRRSVHGLVNDVNGQPLKFLTNVTVDH